MLVYNWCFHDETPVINLAEPMLSRWLCLSHGNVWMNEAGSGASARFVLCGGPELPLTWFLHFLFCLVCREKMYVFFVLHWRILLNSCVFDNVWWHGWPRWSRVGSRITGVVSASKAVVIQSHVDPSMEGVETTEEQNNPGKCAVVLEPIHQPSTRERRNTWWALRLCQPSLLAQTHRRQ